MKKPSADLQAARYAFPEWCDKTQRVFARAMHRADLLGQLTGNGKLGEEAFDRAMRPRQRLSVSARARDVEDQIRLYLITHPKDTGDGS